MINRNWTIITIAYGAVLAVINTIAVNGVFSNDGQITNPDTEIIAIPWTAFQNRVRVLINADPLDDNRAPLSYVSSTSTFDGDSYNDIEDYPELTRAQKKRGLSGLARWKPFSNLGRQRSPIKHGVSRADIFQKSLGYRPAYTQESQEATDDMMETSGEFKLSGEGNHAFLRPAAQPLRWG